MDAAIIALPNSPYLKTNRTDPFLEFLKKEQFNIQLEDEIENADYLFLYPNLLNELYKICHRYKNKILVFITGESVSPDFNLFDYAFGYDPIDFGDRYLQIQFQSQFYDYSLAEQKQSSTERLNEKTKFCNFIYSNPVAHPQRDSFFKKLCTYKKVDSLGKHLRNVSHATSDRHVPDFFNASVLEKKPYKFSIAFENACQTGYNTEKIISSFLANTIPIYWGDREISKYYNPKSFINSHDYNNFEEVIEKVKELDNDENKYFEMLSEKPRTTGQQKIFEKQKEELINRIQFIFDQPYQQAFRKPVGTFNDFYSKDKISASNPGNKLWIKVHHQAYLAKKRMKTYFSKSN